MSSPDTESVQQALNELARAIDKLMTIRAHDTFLDENGTPRMYILKTIANWLRERYPNEKIPVSAVWGVFYQLKPAYEEEDERADRPRNMANVGYYQRGRDYQWEQEDLEPGHWEDHMTPPDWTVED